MYKSGPAVISCQRCIVGSFIIRLLTPFPGKARALSPNSVVETVSNTCQGWYGAVGLLTQLVCNGPDPAFRVWTFPQPVCEGSSRQVRSAYRGLTYWPKAGETSSDLTALASLALHRNKVRFRSGKLDHFCACELFL